MLCLNGILRCAGTKGAILAHTLVWGCLKDLIFTRLILGANLCINEA
jgi:hypothetical protein